VDDTRLRHFAGRKPKRAAEAGPLKAYHLPLLRPPTILTSTYLYHIPHPTMRRFSPIFGSTGASLLIPPRYSLRHIFLKHSPLVVGSRTSIHTRSIVPLHSIVRIPHPPQPNILLSRSISNMSLAEAQEKTEGLSGTSDLPPAEEQHKKINAWSGPGPAAFDFRSMS
jgi:hypothetical protein